MKNLSLDALKVLDLADESASYCSRLLADMGAKVTKLEHPGGDPSRRYGPFYRTARGAKESLFFLHHNQGKRGITLNLRRKEGRDIFCRLVKGQHVVIESFPPGYLDKIGLGFSDLRQINPRLIMVSVTGFGQGGDCRGHKSCDLVAAATGGQVYVSGSPKTPPLQPFGGQPYYIASLYAAIGVLLAVRKAAQENEGAQVDISLQEAAAATLDQVLTRYFAENVVTTRQGGQHWSDAFGVLPTEDGHLLLSPFIAWPTVTGWLAADGRGGDLGHAKWDRPEYRQTHAGQVYERMAAWTKNHSKNELFQTAQLMRLPWAPVFAPSEVAQSPQLKARDFLNAGGRDKQGPGLKTPGLTALSEKRPSARAPKLGQDNLAVYQKELGLSLKEIARLKKLKVI
jgi:crotonobetainyl-CoA:carnitine CoA-transferase CaiB-like acyl-CoA transferase